MRPTNDARSAAGDAAHALSIRRFLRSLLSAAAILVLSVSAANATPAFKILKNFAGVGGNPETSLLEISDAGISHFYGTAMDEGGFGTVFRISPNADGGFTTTTLHEFNGLDGAQPMSTLVQGPDGDLYGTTWVGGQYDNGTVFRVSKNGASFSSLYSFSGGADGQVPGTLFLAPDGYFYGTTSGGASTKGTIFRIWPDGSGFSTLHTFSGPDGAQPQGGALILIGGMLYGTTAGGTGSAASGTIFRVSTGGTGFETIHFFSSSTDGSYPWASLILGASGELYGTAPHSGPSNGGTFFKLGTDGSGFTVLHAFATESSDDGAAPYGGLLLASNGSFYGTTESGGASNLGTVFKISATGSNFEILHSFDGSDGYSPVAAVIQGSDGALYGTATGAGPCNAGTVFRLAVDGTAFDLLETFPSGNRPESGVIRGLDGRLYGMTQWGDGCTTGVVFAINGDGSAYTRLHAFTGSDGAEAFSQLTQAPDGTLYGTTSAGGDGYSPCGNVFEVSPDGSGFLSIHTFLGLDGCHPAARLVRTPDGSLFGTTMAGGSMGYGTVFKLSKVGEDWSMATLHFFDGLDGSSPRDLTLAADGNLYGTTGAGGTSTGGGTVFRISTLGAFTSLYSFASPAEPLGALTEGAAGWFYGVTYSGGPADAGTIFKIYEDGTGLTTLHTFSGGAGSHPVAGLTRDSSGNFYGTTTEGGTPGFGTVFMLAADESTFTMLHEFGGGPDDGDHPAAALTLVDGNLYGTTYDGGWSEFGTVFRIQLGTSAPSAAISADGATTLCEGNGVLLTATPSAGTGSYVSYQWYRDLVLIGGATSSTYTATVTGVYSATVTDSDGNRSAKSEGVTVTVNPAPEASIIPSGTYRLCPASTVTLTASAGSSWLWSTGATTRSIEVDTPGDYTVTVTDALGCSATSSATTVAGTPAPTATVGGGGTICARGSSTVSLTLTGTPPWSVTWSDGFTDSGISSSLQIRTVSPRSTTIYSVISVSDAYCSAAGAGSATVTVADPPKAVLKGSATICPGSTTDLTVELTGTPPWTLTWSDASYVESNITDPHHVRTVSPSVSTIYSIIEVADNGCSPGTARGSARIKLAAPDATITTRSTVCVSSTRNTASVSTAGKGATYSWNVTNGTITSGEGTRSIQFTPGPSGYVDLQVTVTSVDGCVTTGPTTSVLIDTGC